VRQLITLKDRFPTRSRSTRYRWRRNPAYGLPAPAMNIGGIDYYHSDELDHWQPPAGPSPASRMARFASKQATDTPDSTA
jgi:hypothetical protein